VVRDVAILLIFLIGFSAYLSYRHARFKANPSYTKLGLVSALAFIILMCLLAMLLITLFGIDAMFFEIAAWLFIVSLAWFLFFNRVELRRNSGSGDQ